MKTPAAISAKEAPAKQERGLSSAPVVQAPQPIFSPPLILQRKCACGGECPSCKEEKLEESHPLQTKLKVNTPGDVFEQEADRIADQVVGMSAPPHGVIAPLRVTPVTTSRAQRKSFESASSAVSYAVEKSRGRAAPTISKNRDHLPGSSCPPLLQRKCACGGGVPCSQCEVEPETVAQRKAAPGSGKNIAGPETLPQNFSFGQPLDDSIRVYMESRFGSDFSEVRIHDSANAASAAQSVNALAYTVGRNIVFNAGQYSPATTDGRRVLAHELTHVLQQRTGTSAAALQRKEAPLPDSAGDPESVCDISGDGTEQCPPVPTHRGDAPLPFDCPSATFAGSNELARLHFCEDSDCLAAPDRLDFLDAVIDTQPDNTGFILHGYSSSEGKADYNSRLSCHRVIRVARALAKRLRQRLEQDKKMPEDQIRTAIKDRIELGSRGASSDFAGGAKENRVVVVYAQAPGRDPDAEPACKDAPRNLGDIQPDPGCDPPTPTLKLEEMEGNPQLGQFHFCMGSDVLSDAPVSSIVSYARRRAAGSTFVVQGFASKEGAADSNQRLSCHRALRLARELMNAGVRSEQIREVSGRGATDHFSKEEPEFNRIALVLAEGGDVPIISENTKAANVRDEAAIVAAAQSRIFSGQYELAADAYISFWTCGRTATVKAAVERLSVLVPSKPLVDKFEQRDIANGAEESGDFNVVLEANTARLSNTALRADNPVECTMGRIIDMAFHHAVKDDSALNAPFSRPEGRDLRHQVGLHLVSLAGLTTCLGRFAQQDDTKKTGVDAPLLNDPLAGVDPLSCARPPQTTRLLPPAKGEKDRGSPTFLPFEVSFGLQDGLLVELHPPTGTSTERGGVRTLRTDREVLHASANVSVVELPPRNFGDYEVGLIQTILDDSTLGEYVSGHLLEQKLPTPIRAAQMQGEPSVPEPWMAFGARRLDSQGQAAVDAKWFFDTSFPLLLNALPGNRDNADILDTLHRHTTVAIWLVARRLGAPLDRFSVHFLDGNIYEITQDVIVDFRRKRGDMQKDPRKITEQPEAERELLVFETAFRAGRTSSEAADPRLAQFTKPVAGDIDFLRQAARVVEPSAPGQDAITRPQFEQEAREILDHLVLFGSEADALGGREGVETPRLGFVRNKLDIEVKVNPASGRMRPTTGISEGEPTIVIRSLGVDPRVLEHLAVAVGLRLEKRDFRKQGRSIILKDPPANGIVAFSLLPTDTRKLGSFDEVIEDMAEMFACTSVTERELLNSREFGAVYFVDRDQKIHRAPSPDFAMSPRQTDDGWKTGLPCGVLPNSFTFGTVHTHPESDGSDHEKKPSGPDIILARGGKCGIDHYVVSRFGVFEYHHPDPKPAFASEISGKFAARFATKTGCRQRTPGDDLK
jgi:outer membrane protein OmpA-like peptidoglycan-associated protein